MFNNRQPQWWYKVSVRLAETERHGMVGTPIEQSANGESPMKAGRANAAMLVTLPHNDVRWHTQ
jgi:hypothetical protein